MDENTTHTAQSRGIGTIVTIIFVILLVVGTLSSIYIRYLSLPPSNFPIGSDVVIDEGLTLRDITVLLEEHNIVRSSHYLYILLLAQGKETSIQAGSYRFPERFSADEVSRTITHGEFRSPLIKVTLPEGFSAKEILNYFPESFDAFDVDSFIAYEGKLFPDTYFISPDATSDDIRSLLLTTFNEKLKPYENEIRNSKFTLDDVIILASIIEREAKDLQSKKIVSGILQNRLAHNMPLQVDATFDYLLGKESSELTDDDLAIDSPFNTYTHRGLPPAPISNPGIESIESVLEPVDTVYFYYLTAPDGTFYYARTFDEHKRNKVKYLST